MNRVPESSIVKLAVAVTLVAAALLTAVARPATAVAAPPCWKALLNDWYDGRIDNTYPVHCYRDAIKHLPADVQTYSSARDDILRALQTAQARIRRSGRAVTPQTPVPPAANTTSTRPTRRGKTPSTTTPAPSTSTTPVAPPSPGRKPSKGIGSLADKLNPSSPSSLPVPLLVLGALALLLVAAGGAGLLIKRRQDRNPAS